MKCYYPQRKKKSINGAVHTYEHACGQCLACRITTRSAWKLRILLESLDWTETSFITLTYNPENLPINENYQGILDKNDLKKFFKRLRKQTSRKFRYFACGEYGDKGNRPHYHAILYGHSFTDRKTIERAWSKTIGRGRNQKIEPIGHVDARYLTTARAGYVAKYALKRLGESEPDITGKPPEFAAMSKDPGIGFNHVEKLVDALYRAATNNKKGIMEIYHENLRSISIGGSSLPIHRTLKRKIYKEIRRREEKNLGIIGFEKIDRKGELKKALLTEQTLVLQDPMIKKLEENNSKALAERKARATRRANKL